ncbi:hypothetical protein NDU88_000683 [Pleurodeles waltl]|uniref:Uncharacterized protein n=1 Tax=Pleurodeles waltl TaxID=8319 RepID=A0AAV7S8H9_PLEWA|nr:hypothetical protein NDU88_000683 [Pleurodeles waltl]
MHPSAYDAPCYSTQVLNAADHLQQQPHKGVPQSSCRNTPLPRDTVSNQAEGSNGCQTHQQMRSQLATLTSKVNARTTEKAKKSEGTARPSVKASRRFLQEARRPTIQFHKARKPEWQPTPQGLRGTQPLTSPLETPSPGLQHPSPAGSATRHAAQSTGQLQRRSRNQASHLGPKPKGGSTAYGLPPQPRGLQTSWAGRGCSFSYTWEGVHTSPAPPTTAPNTPGTGKGPCGPKSSAAALQDHACAAFVFVSWARKLGF